jgi:endonuclease YncB( thermonuclease family)
MMMASARISLWALLAAVGASAPAALTRQPAESRGRPEVILDAARAAGPISPAYRADLLRVVDGDTIEARVALWLDQSLTTLVRLRDVDAPELASTCGHERARAVAARERLAHLLEQGRLLLTDVGRDKYGGRVLARVATPDGADVGALLVAEGHARVWRGRREAWC